MASSAAPTPLSSRAGSPPDPRRIGAIIGGSLAALIALALFISGVGLVWAHTTQRDAAGYYDTGFQSLSTPATAITAEDLELNASGHDVRWVTRQLDARIRLRATGIGEKAVFVGIARQAGVDRYLATVAHESVGSARGPGMDGMPGRRWMSGELTNPLAVGQAVAPPTSTGIWVAKASGPGLRSLDWTPTAGRWAAVVMNADGSPGVRAQVAVGAHTAVLLPIGLVLLALSLLFAGISAGLLTTAGRSGGPVAAGAVATVGTSAGTHEAGVAFDKPAVAAATDKSETTTAASYPVVVDGSLDEPLSRWLWLVKWFLAIPHTIVLVFLWAGFVVSTLVALVAIVVTGRYPRRLFDYNVGVLRWNWRVQFYAGAAMGTDRYPPFTLASVPDYPAQLEIPYPEHLSRGKALVKTWLLAIPHYLVLGALFGGNVNVGNASVQAPGLAILLVLFALVTLTFTGRYPREMFRIVLGCNRWLYRVIAYAALMRDEYPPFRLDR
jgi:hypothetical protein